MDRGSEYVVQGVLQDQIERALKKVTFQPRLKEVGEGVLWISEERNLGRIGS